MAESNLSLAYPEFMSRVGRFLGYGPTSANWSAAQTTQIDEIVQEGYRWFLEPGEDAGLPPHEWTFLRPATTLATVASDYDYDLPDDFGWLACQSFTFATTANVSGGIQIVGEGIIRALREGTGTNTGVPTHVAARPKAATAGATGQRWEAVFYPTPDAIYTLGYRYHVLASKLTTALPYPLGGERHGSTILAACLAVAEKEANDEQGLQFASFLSRMKASIRADQRSEPETYGYCGDGVNVYKGNVPLSTPFTYNGVLGT